MKDGIRAIHIETIGMAKDESKNFSNVKSNIPLKNNPSYIEANYTIHDSIKVLTF
jgi:hypothetical protein